MERQFDQQLDKLKTRLIKMCSLVDEQVDFSLRSIEEENLELASLVIDREKKVDKYDVKIEKICQKIFALNQPVAMDLRLIMSALTITSNLERMGDIAVNLAEEMLKLKVRPGFADRILFNQMSRTVRGMVRNSIDSFIENDPKLAQKVMVEDNKLDDLNRENHRILISIMKETVENIETGISMVSISREMERLGDHATNIAEDVYFIVEAQLIKHKYEKFFLDESEEEDGEES